MLPKKYPLNLEGTYFFVSNLHHVQYLSRYAEIFQGEKWFTTLHCDSGSGTDRQKDANDPNVYQDPSFLG